MSDKHKDQEYDVIVVGSGACGATIARDISHDGKRVLLLERGGYAPLRESFVGIASIAEEVKLGEGQLSTVRAVTTGGSTCMYFGVVTYPPLDVFRALGIELAQHLEQVRAELPITPMSDVMMTPQLQRLREAALVCGHDWRQKDLLVDRSRCANGYSYEAKWNARSYVDEAVHNGATLVNRCTVLRVITDRGTAVGVEYKVKRGAFSSDVQRAHGKKIILAAGELATPKILRDSGLQGIGNRGFYCNPGYAIYGIVPGLRGASGFCGATAANYDEDIELGDAVVPKALHAPMMLGGLKFRQLFNFPETIGIGVKVKDGLAGQLSDSGRFHKNFDRTDHLKLDKGRREAIRVLKQAGAKHIVDFGLTAAGRVGGLIRIGEHLSSNLETHYRNLHVCDGSVIPDAMRGTPTLTLVTLSKYLSRHLLSVL